MDYNKDFKIIYDEIKARAEKYSINSSSHKCFIEESHGFYEGVNWTILKLYQLGYLNVSKEDK